MRWNRRSCNQRRSAEKQIQLCKAAIGLTAAAFSRSSSRLLQCNSQSTVKLILLNWLRCCVCGLAYGFNKTLELQRRRRPPEWVGADELGIEPLRLGWKTPHFFAFCRAELTASQGCLLFPKQLDHQLVRTPDDMVAKIKLDTAAVFYTVPSLWHWFFERPVGKLHIFAKSFYLLPLVLYCGPLALCQAGKFQIFWMTIQFI